MKKCEVLVDRCSLVVGKGSIVYVDERQFELARNFIKPLGEEKTKEPKTEKPKEEVKENVVEEKPKKKSKK